MERNTADNLSSAFAAASLAEARFRVYALRAQSDGHDRPAMLFEAAAEAAAVHARRFMRLLRGKIGTTDENLDVLLTREMPDLSESYRQFLADAEDTGVKVAMEVFDHAGKVVSQITNRIRTLVEADPGGAADGPYRVCQVCGYTALGEIPDRCPICNGVASKFKTLFV
jgi:rubrerythrin